MATLMTDDGRRVRFIHDDEAPLFSNMMSILH